MHGVRQRLVRPHFVHGDYMLTDGYKDRRHVVFVHRLSGAGRLQCGSASGSRGRRFACFDGLETTEALGIYRVRALLTESGRRFDRLLL
ncbi:hypothetical protein ACP70R_001120 [Stipagrostis hirtigluma subsp. patula]